MHPVHRIHRLVWSIVAAGSLVLLLAACGGGTSSSSTSTTTTGTSTTTTSSPVTSPVASPVSSPVASPIASPMASPGASPAASGGSVVQVTTNPQLGPILTDSSGMTLYTYDKDTPGTSACTGTCATNWPPLMTTGTPTPPSGLTGTLGTITRADGTMQVTYNGKPLYHYKGDSASGDTKGDGIGGVWHVAKASS